jgi:hydroxyacylglutathione hydrolase
MILRHLYEPSLAQSAYLIGCAETGEAIVIDPNADVSQYVAAAEAEGLRITAVTETHIHADFVSGARALAATSAAALYVSGEGGMDWQYAFRDDPGVHVLSDGDVIEVGRIRLTAVHTPGHTPEHLMFVVTDARTTNEPLGLITGDFLFVGDVGRPDLLETAAKQVGTMESSARRLFSSLRRLRELPDRLLIWPGHGSGSACGKSLAGVPVSSLGYERLTNWALREGDEQAFVASVLSDQPDPPLYFGEMKQVNRLGAPAWSAVPALTALDADALSAAVASRQLLIDVRAQRRTGLLPGSIVIPMNSSFSAWAGSVVLSTEQFVIVAEGAGQAAAARRTLALIGRPAAKGWISTAHLARYQAGGGRLDEIPITERIIAGYTMLDVRASAEWKAGHLPGATHVPLARLTEHVDGLDKSAPTIVYCQSGVRSLIAASLLRRLGFINLASLVGGYSRLQRSSEQNVVVA